MYILPEHKARIKMIMRDMYINHSHHSRKKLRAYKLEFKHYMQLYKGIDFNQIAITK